MTWALRRTEKALDDLAAIFDYIATDNPRATEVLIARLLSKEPPTIRNSAGPLTTPHRPIASLRMGDI